MAHFKTIKLEGNKMIDQEMIDYLNDEVKSYDRIMKENNEKGFHLMDDSWNDSKRIAINIIKLLESLKD